MSVLLSKRNNEYEPQVTGVRDNQQPDDLEAGQGAYSGAKKVFSQPPIVQVLPLKKMREACNFHYRYTSTMTDNKIKINPEKSHCRIFYEFICKLWWKVSIWSITKVSQYFVTYSLLAMTEIKRFL